MTIHDYYDIWYIRAPDLTQRCCRIEKGKNISTVDDAIAAFESTINKAKVYSIVQIILSSYGVNEFSGNVVYALPLLDKDEEELRGERIE